MRIYHKTDEAYPRIIGEGVMSLDEIKEAFADALADPSFVTGIGTIIDITGSESDRTHEEVREMAFLFAQCRDPLGHRLALVVSDSLHYGLGRMLSAYAELRQLDVEVCHSLDEAVQWLEQGPSSLDRG